jgi:hypothetical protein
MNRRGRYTERTCADRQEEAHAPLGGKEPETPRGPADAGPLGFDSVRYLPRTENSITSMNSLSPWFDNMVNRTNRTLSLPVFGT